MLCSCNLCDSVQRKTVVLKITANSPMHSHFPFIYHLWKLLAGSGCDLKDLDKLSVVSPNADANADTAMFKAYALNISL